MNIFTNTMADMNWVTIKDHANRDAIVLLPMGVIEEHGPQLCTATDIYTAHIHCVNVADKLHEQGYDAVIAPPFYWGICQANKGFIGSFSIRPETAQALLYDILCSLKEFGFSKVFAINAHGDVEHKLTALRAFSEACEKLDMTACFPFEKELLPHFGLTGQEPHIYLLAPQNIQVSYAAVGDVHAGDVETAMISAYYPGLVDHAMAESLPDVPLSLAKWEAWMFGGQIKQLSSQGYLGSPSSYKTVDIEKNREDWACRIAEGIVARINKDYD